MDEGPRTFRDHILSIYQSAVADLARQVEADHGSDTRESMSQSPGSLQSAAEEIAALRAAGRTNSHVGASSPEKETEALETMSVGETAGVCASLGLQYLEAKIFGDTATAERIKAEIEPGSKCDRRWISTLDAYLGYFGPSGTRREIPYVKPSQVGSRVIPIKSNARVALIGDWGTGAEPAKRILRQANEQKPDVVIHLGDIYYSGTEVECRTNFETIVDEVLHRPQSNVAVYTLAGNHDMYCGGIGYYGLIKRLNKGKMAQQASFFCLRSEDNAWQLVAMDTGLHDYSPFAVTDVETFVEPDELAWHEQRIKEFPGKTILLSHHQLFSAFSQIGRPAANGMLRAYNPRLKEVFDRLRGTGKQIAAWFWGHEHNLCIYKPYLDLRRGRCLGHSAIPVFKQDEPYKLLERIEDPPTIVEQTKLSLAGDIYTHGFATLAFKNDVATADYFEDRNGTAVKFHSETID